MDHLHRRLLLAGSLFVLLSTAFAEDEPSPATAPNAPPELTQLETQFEAAKQAATANILARYKADLTALEERYTKSTNLDGAMAVKAELDTVFSDICGPPIALKGNVQEFTQLQKNFDDAIQSAFAPLQDRYKSSLSTLETRFSRAGNLAGAMAVKNSLENLPVTGKWRTVSPEYSFIVTFNSDGTWTRTVYTKGAAKDYTGTWTWKDPGKHVIGLVSDEGKKNECDVLSDGNKLDFHVSSKGRQLIYRLP